MRLRTDQAGAHLPTLAPVGSGAEPQVALCPLIALFFVTLGCAAVYFANAILRPVRTLSRAASRISTTMTLFSSEFRPDGLNWPRATPAKYVMESRSAGGRRSEEHTSELQSP